MTLSEYMNSQFSLWQNVDFFLRIAAACVCGACIGAERSKRYKEAGIRTHIIVCCASALLMIVSKYGFADLTDPAGAMYSGIRGADPARIAAQVVSGISFLGAGVIFKHGNAVRGLTTAAGLWATAGIGLAMGAGMYPVGVFGTLMIALLQILMHKFVMQADALASNHLHFTVQDSTQFHERLGDYLQERNVQIMDSRITYHDDGFVSYDITVRAPREMTISDLNQFLRSCGDVRGISYTPIY